MLREVFTPEALLTFANALEHGPERLVMWWLDKLLMDHQMKLGFAQRIMREHGLRALERTPSVIVGTIHSVKGGEADRVLVFPDLSPAAYQDSSGEGMDKTLRVFYVGMTRARERLILATPSGPLAVGWNTKAGWRW
jgi:superfamily I DNA/RNA helicase